MDPTVPGAHLLVARGEVDAAFGRLAAATQPLIDRDTCVLMGVLLGGLLPLARLASQLQGDFILDTCRVGRYGDATRGGLPQWLAQPRATLRDRHVILVDDIYDEVGLPPMPEGWLAEKKLQEEQAAKEAWKIAVP